MSSKYHKGDIDRGGEIDGQHDQRVAAVLMDFYRIPGIC